MNRNPVSWAVAVALFLSWTASAAEKPHASTLDAGKERPWALNVPAQEQEVSRELFDKGNALLDTSLPKAAEYYIKALAKWNHPAIHFNLALVRMELDQPVEAYQDLIEAMRYGEEPLDEQKFETARSYKSLLEQQLVPVKVFCREAGATVAMNGRTIPVSSEGYEGLLRPGIHSFIATKAGYVDTNVSLNLEAGKPVSVKLELFTEEQLTELRTLWPVWQPWAVMGAGVAAVAGGGLLHWKAREDFNGFDLGAKACEGKCTLQESPELSALYSRGAALQRVAIGTYAAGGAAVLTGAVLLYLNRPLPHRINLQEKGVQVTPLLGGGTGGAQVTLRF